ncbi:hypothetical protein SDJN02_25559, partial [Cucurbita argyrosperma subsp. argyrosperma]
FCPPFLTGAIDNTITLKCSCIKFCEFQPLSWKVDATGNSIGYDQQGKQGKQEELVHFSRLGIRDY